jgi:hypothetical protein
MHRGAAACRSTRRPPVDTNRDGPAVADHAAGSDATTPEQNARRVPLLAKLLVESFAGTGVEGHLRVRLVVDDEPSLLITLEISDLDKMRSTATVGDDLARLWAQAIDEMTSRVCAELAFSGSAGFTNPINVHSHLSSAGPTPLTEIPPAGTVLAMFTL